MSEFFKPLRVYLISRFGHDVAVGMPLSFLSEVKHSNSIFKWIKDGFSMNGWGNPETLDRLHVGMGLFNAAQDECNYILSKCLPFVMSFLAWDICFRDHDLFSMLLPISWDQLTYLNMINHYHASGKVLYFQLL